MSSFYAAVIDRALRGLRHALPELAEIRPGQGVLDVCCGTGDQAVHLARLGAEVDGVDLDPAMIAVAEARRRRFGRDNLRFQLADAAALPFGASLFDVAAISLALHEKPFDTRLKVVSEMRRVVKPGGIIVLADFGVPARRFFSFIESLVGGEHYANFKDYQAGGGLLKLVHGLNLTVENRAAALGGGIDLLKIRN
ncbi:methyltransferase domain-containing protein [Dehalogenimonas sp. 4OHTPN]|uniref:Methyltransferase domain-containing protein n=1 Tax=Dehalogenimonas sp. 4OHTPN TaxID=3166643 RepID=A0AAU8G9B5_9CHLR